MRKRFEPIMQPWIRFSPLSRRQPKLSGWSSGITPISVAVPCGRRQSSACIATLASPIASNE